MKAIRVLIAAAGGDYGQWRALAGPLMKAAFRSADISQHMTRHGGKLRLASWSTLLPMGVCGGFLALAAAGLPSPFHVGLVVLSPVGFVVFYLLLLNFQAVAVSPVDYQVLGHRPVNSRTYLLARLCVTLAHQGLVVAPLCLPAALVCAVRFGLLSALGLALATALLVLTVALGLIGIYGTLIRKMAGRRLTWLLSGLQLVLVLFYLILILPGGVSGRAFDGVGALAPEGWALAVPLAWFAGFASLVSGNAGAAEWVGLGAVPACCFAVAWFARDKLSLASAQNLGAALDAGARRDAERNKGARSRAARGRRRGVAGTLILGQLRHDMPFRMSALGLLVLPILGLLSPWFLSGLGLETLDPFVPGADVLALSTIHASVLVVPASSLFLLCASDSWRAGWVFFSGPVDRGRVAAEARRCVALLVLLPCLILAFASFVWLFETVWRALVHAALLGGLGALAVQLAQYALPHLPFTIPASAKRQSGLLSAVMLPMLILAFPLGSLAAFIYASPQRTAAAFVALAAGIAAMEWALPRRLNRRLRWLEIEN